MLTCIVYIYHHLYMAYLDSVSTLCTLHFVLCTLHSSLVLVYISVLALKILSMMELYHKYKLWHFRFHLQIESDLAIVRRNVTAVRKELQSHTTEVMGLLGKSLPEWTATLTHILSYYMWQSQVEIKHYPIVYFDCV